MCQMDIDNNNQSEQITFLNVLIYAVDEHGICHLFKTEMLTQLQSIPVNTEEKMDVSKSIVVLSNQIDNSLQLINEDLIQNSSNFHSVEYLSTQPFSIFDVHENNLSSLHLFNDDISTPTILSPPLQLSGHIASQYQNKILINSNDNISKRKIKKKKKKLHYPSHRFMVLKKQFKAYLKKRKKKQQDQNQLNNISNVIIHHQSQQIESSPIEHSTMIDFQLSPDLSKRKYIYKDINLTNNNQNQMNWRIFQCTQQSSCFDQTVTNDRSYHPFYCANDRISLPDIRIGLSRHHSIKQLHKTIID